jgi:transcriptional regulator with XRE-family HTH domain
MTNRENAGALPLRLTRRHRNWTLERVVSEIDSYLGGSGVTGSLVSAWERGTRRTSPRYRAALCAIYADLPLPMQSKLFSNWGSKHCDF